MRLRFATTELDDNGEGPDFNTYERSLLAELVLPSPNADCKEYSGLSLEEFRKLGRDEFRQPTKTEEKCRSGDRQRTGCERFRKCV